MPTKKKVTDEAVKTEKKAAPKKATKKTTTKTTAKKATVKKETAKKETVANESAQKYIDVINWKKWEAHHMNWLYIEINAGDLNNEIEAGVNNLKTCCDAMRECMLEGDTFVEEPKRKTAANLVVRYYCDNLSDDRRKYSEVQE